MIHVQFAIYNNESDKIHKLVEGFRFPDAESAQDYINKKDIKATFRGYNITTRLRPVLIWRDTKTGEKSIESLD